MMGVGKSTIGKYLSKKLKIPFEDLDRRIEKLESLSISQIFEYKGESYFRKIEENVSLKMIKKKPKVIAVGGGALINPSIRRNVKKSCLSIWLDLLPKEIFIMNKDLDAVSALIILEDYCNYKFALSENIDIKTWLK